MIRLPGYMLDDFVAVNKQLTHATAIISFVTHDALDAFPVREKTGKSARPTTII